MNSTVSFNDFLEFERAVFGDEYPIAAYDPALIRYGEYRFALESLPFQPGQTVLDLGCEANIFLLYLAYRGCRLIGVDVDPNVWRSLEERKKRVEKVFGQTLDVTFKADDATRLTAPPDSVDGVIAISSIEHMFSPHGHGDQLAIESIARVLKPGGAAVVTVPMSNGTPFHEAPKGDKRFAGPYRLYTPEVLRKRYLSDPALELVRFSYLANSTPDVRFDQMHFHLFWLQKLKHQDRAKWAWAQPILAGVFNPIISVEEGVAQVYRLNTALICFRKRVSFR